MKDCGAHETLITRSFGHLINSGAKDEFRILRRPDLFALLLSPDSLSYGVLPLEERDV